MENQRQERDKWDLWNRADINNVDKDGALVYLGFLALRVGYAKLYAQRPKYCSVEINEEEAREDYERGKQFFVRKFGRDILNNCGLRDLEKVCLTKESK